MRRSRMVALTGAVALATSALGATTTAASAQEAAASATTAPTGYAVLAKDGTDVRVLAQRLEQAGGTVTSVNTDIGLVSVESTKTGFAASARSVAGVAAAATDGVVGRSPDAGRVKDRVVRENQESAARTATRGRDDRGHGKGPKGATADPLDSLLWGMDMINAPQAHKTELGDKRVRVGIMDTGVDGDPSRPRAQLRQPALPQLRHRHPRDRRSVRVRRVRRPGEPRRQRPRHARRRHHRGEPSTASASRGSPRTWTSSTCGPVRTAATSSSLRPSTR